jgi:uncharacterized protein (DUF2147 family)
MKRRIFSIALIFSFYCANIFAQTTASDAVIGVWLSADKDGKVQIYKQGDKYYGKLVWMKAPRKDDKNPEAKLKNRDLQGVILLNGFKFTGKAWEDGTIYDPKNGKTYSCIIKSTGANSLDIRGFVGISLLGRTTLWSRTTL